MFKRPDYISKSFQGMETIIGPLVKVEGNFVGEGDVIVEGKVKGSLETKNNIRIGSKAQVRANIKAENVFVAGQVRGNIRTQGKIELASSARVFGDIEAKIVLIAEGAIFNGKCVMEGEEKTKEKIAKQEDKISN